MNFGEWIRMLRKQHNYDIRTLAEQSGVEASTISRVENERTQVTLLIAIRLCEGLGVSVSDVLTEVYGVEPFKSAREGAVGSGAAPTEDDVEQFLSYYRDHRKEARNWLTDLLNKVNSMNGNPARTLKPSSSRFFGPEDIQKLLFDSTLYRFEIQYPPALTADQILAIYERGSMLTLTDIAEFTKKLRREKQVTLAKLERGARISQNMLSRLESPFIEQIKLADVVMFDELLERGGTLLKMYWSVYSFYQRLVRRSASTADQEMKLASIFVVICRWLQFLSPQDTSWMEHVRAFEKLV
jgi:transcriptional regulator with XRE-family HTH domain